MNWDTLETLSYLKQLYENKAKKEGDPVMKIYACSPITKDNVLLYGLVLLIPAKTLNDAKKEAYNHFKPILGDNLKSVMCKG